MLDKIFKNIIFLLLFYFLVNSAYAYDLPFDSAYDTIESAAASVNKDVSQYYLGLLFGSVGGLLPGQDYTLLSQLFSKYNTAIFCIIALFVGYGLITNVISMSEEGSFLGGEQRPGYWQTIRPIVGSSLLYPVYNGYSTAQYLVIKATITGVLVANAIFAQLTTFGKAVNLSAPSPPVPSVTLPFESFNKFALQYYISKMCVDAKTVNSDLCMRSDGTCPDKFYRLVVNTTKPNEDFFTM